MPNCLSSIYLSEAWLVVPYEESECLAQGGGTLIQDGAARREEEHSVWQKTRKANVGSVNLQMVSCSKERKQVRIAATLTEHRDAHGIQQDTEPRELLDAGVGLGVALDRVVRTKEALPVAEVLARKGAEGRRAHHGKHDEKEHQLPRQGRIEHLLGTPMAKPAR
eukprot:scaffold30559_cov69-Phaeocystis_antarctica.AAC.6